jgi:hypothetical protein
MAPEAESLIHQFPTTDMLIAWGTINYVWAQVDVASTGALCSVLDIDGVEFGIVIGKLETEAKLSKIRKILIHRNNITQADKVESLRKILEKLRPTRNAITHGSYVGSSKELERFFSLPTEFLVGDGQECANALHVLKFSDVNDHVEGVVRVVTTLVEEFKGERLSALLSLPVRAPSYSPPKTPLPPRGKTPK